MVAISARFASGFVYVQLKNGIEIKFPICFNKRLSSGSKTQLSNIKILNESLYWPDLNEKVFLNNLFEQDFGQSPSLMPLENTSENEPKKVIKKFNLAMIIALTGFISLFLMFFVVSYFLSKSGNPNKKNKLVSQDFVTKESEYTPSGNLIVETDAPPGTGIQWVRLRGEIGDKLRKFVIYPGIGNHDSYNEKEYLQLTWQFKFRRVKEKKSDFRNVFVKTTIDFHYTDSKKIFRNMSKLNQVFRENFEKELGLCKGFNIPENWYSDYHFLCKFIRSFDDLLNKEIHGNFRSPPYFSDYQIEETKDR